MRFLAGMPIYWKFDYHSTITYLETQKMTYHGNLYILMQIHILHEAVKYTLNVKKCNSMLHQLRYTHKCFVAHHLSNQVLVKKETRSYASVTLHLQGTSSQIIISSWTPKSGQMPWVCQH